MNAKNQELDPRYGVREVAIYLGVGRSKVLGWIARGELRAANVATSLGRRPQWKVAKSELDRFIAARTNVPPAPPTPRRRRGPDFEVKEFV